ncbi:MAG: hypothetical protein FVQ81_04690 [Candidatus Glassbacteria bacterium]|nr:hypothetical protein [Candidatus Glassbacteria bacterium]
MSVHPIPNRTERVTVRIALWTALPLLTGILCWWTAAAVHIYGLLPLPGGMIPFFAYGGLAAGLLACLVFGRRMTGRFYSVRRPVVPVVYFCCTVVSFALAMGVPVLVPLPGIALGIYMGRRLANGNAGPEEAKKQAKSTALLAAGVSGLFGAGSILMAALDNSLAGNIGRMLGVEWGRETILAGAVLLLPVLMGIQYLLTRWAVRFSQRLK